MSRARPQIALDATYGAGRHLTGVGVYSRRILDGLAESRPEVRWLHLYRSQRLLAALKLPIRRNITRRLLWGPFVPRNASLFHGLNQRLPEGKFRRAITTFHDLFVLTGEYSTPDFRARFAEQARDAASRSDLIIAVSQFTASQVQELLNVPAAKLRVVPHGVDLPPNTEVPHLSQREKRILFVGALQERKNGERLIEAFEMIGADWRLTLAGSATGYGAEKILDRIARSKAKERIEVAGYVTSERLRELYRISRIFAFPSLDEGFGIPVLEAMAWGIPVVASNRSALPEAAGDAALLVDPFDAGAIASGIKRLADDSDLSQDLQRKGRARAAEFSWRKAVETTWRVYEELL